ncbi:MAG: GNAT family N-acetyltransferase [Cyclobacteriaceae bacterium]
MNENIVYRKIEINEIEQYHKIRLDCLKNYPQNFGTLYDEEQKSSSFKFDKIIGQQSTTDFLMGAFSNERLVGICGFIKEKREKTKHIGEISGMHVIAEFSGQKIGARLLNTTILTAFKNSALEQIILAVADKNQTAQNLYKKFGFVEYGRLKNYFKDNGEYETQVFMTLVRD